jgi:hypothetical protein
MPAARFKDLCVDARDHQAMARWWAALLGYQVLDALRDGTVRPPDWPIPISDPTGAGPLIWFNAVPEKKAVKNRMHIDVVGITAEILAVGATLLRAKDNVDIEHDVCADPEGNEFCVFAPK